MRVYLIAAPEDQEEAEKLAAYLKRFGVFIRSEFGNMAYPPAHHGEFTLALWSRNAMMSSRQMMLTNRAIDAWAEGQLVMARLEHGLNPRGLADLDMVDLTFPAAREHRYHDVLNALRAMQDAQRRQVAAAAPPPSSSSSGGPFGGGRSEDSGAPRAEQADAGLEGRLTSQQSAEYLDSLDDDLDDLSLEEEVEIEPPMAPAPAPAQSVEPARTSAGFPWFLVSVVALIAIAVVGFFALPTLQQSSEGPSGSADMLSDLILSPWGYGLIGAVVLLIVLRVVIGLARRPRSKPSKREAASVAPREAIPEPAKIEENAEAEVFVSYSHANADTVLPIVESVEEQGLSIWIDRDEMRAGQSWAGQIVRAIKSADRFCIMCSEQSFASDHVRREVYLADKYGKKLVPVRLDGAEMPEDIEYFLISEQWVDLKELPSNERAGAVHRALKGGEG